MFRPVCFARNLGDYTRENLLCCLGIGEQMSNDDLDRNGFFFDLPAIVIGDHRHRSERNLGFACQLRLRQIGHANDIKPISAIEFRLGASGERRPVHAHVSAAVVNGSTAGARGFRQYLPQLGRDRVGKGNVGRYSFAKKRVTRAQTRPIKKLLWQQDVARGIFLLQTADRCHANDPTDVERTQRVNIRAMIQFVRQDTVSTSVPGQKINAATGHCSADDGIGWCAERRFDFVFGELGKTFQLVEATAADNANRWLVHVSLN